MKRKLLTILTFLSAYAAQSQIHEIGLTLGATNYIGDIGSTQYINPTDMGYGFQYRWNKSPRHSWRFNYNYLPISGKDSNSDLNSIFLNLIYTIIGRHLHHTYIQVLQDFHIKKLTLTNTTNK